MQLVDSYLNEVSRFLPTTDRDDILAELRATIEEQMLDGARERRAEPNLEDERRLLAGLGHPLKVASSYQSERYLIGPALFPSYVYTLKWLPVLVFMIQLVIALAAATASDWQISFSGVVFHLLETLLWLVAIVTLVFVAIEQSGDRLDWYGEWRPEQLRSGTVRVINRQSVVSNLVTEGIFLLWWNDALDLLPDFGEKYAPSLGAVWVPLFWPLNILFGAFFLLHAVVLIRGLWYRWSLYGEIALGLVLLGCAAVLLSADELVALAPGVVAPAPGQVAYYPAELQTAVRVMLLAIAGFQIWDLIAAARLLKRDTWRVPVRPGWSAAKPNE